MVVCGAAVSKKLRHRLYRSAREITMHVFDRPTMSNQTDCFIRTPGLLKDRLQKFTDAVTVRDDALAGIRSVRWSCEARLLYDSALSAGSAGRKSELSLREPPVEIYVAPQQLAEDHRGFARSRHRAREHNYFGKANAKVLPEPDARSPSFVSQNVNVVRKNLLITAL
jgi:hypothetical protein